MFDNPKLFQLTSPHLAGGDSIRPSKTHQTNVYSKSPIEFCTHVTKANFAQKHRLNSRSEKVVVRSRVARVLRFCTFSEHFRYTSVCAIFPKKNASVLDLASFFVSQHIHWHSVMNWIVSCMTYMVFWTQSCVQRKRIGRNTGKNCATINCTHDLATLLHRNENFACSARGAGLQVHALPTWLSCNFWRMTGACDCVSWKSCHKWCALIHCLDLHENEWTRIKASAWPFGMSKARTSVFTKCHDI